MNNSHSEEEKRLLFSAAISAVKDFIAGKSRMMKYQFNMGSYELLHKVRVADGITEK